MGSKWFGGIVLLAIVSLLLSWLVLVPKVKTLGNDIQTSLSAAGHDGVDVNMRGLTAVLSGNAKNEAAAKDAVGIAQNTKCSTCKGDKTWHSVKNETTFNAVPTQKPYTFNGVKDASGNVVLSGYVADMAEKSRILVRANEIFDGSVTDRTLQIAQGQPDGQFGAVTETYMKELALLDKGRFTLEDRSGLISGEAATAETRTRINQIGSSLPSGYEFAANISVLNMAAENVGEVKSQSICQTLFDDLNTGKTILFATDKADIRGSESFDLLNNLAAAANQCASFRIAVDGHTDNVGADEYNQWLSEARANTVVAYLRENEVGLSRMTATGFGETQPRASNETDEGRAKNRRIVFTVTQAE